MGRDKELPTTDATYSEAEVNTFMNSPIWRTIEDMWENRYQALTGLLINEIGTDNVEFRRGQLNELAYNKNLKQILMEGSNE